MDTKIFNNNNFVKGIIKNKEDNYIKIIYKQIIEYYNFQNNIKYFFSHGFRKW